MQITDGAIGESTLGHNFREMKQVTDLLVKEGAAKKMFGRTEVLAVPPMFVNKIM